MTLLRSASPNWAVLKITHCSQKNTNKETKLYYSKTTGIEKKLNKVLLLNIKFDSAHSPYIQDSCRQNIMGHGQTRSIQTPCLYFFFLQTPVEIKQSAHNHNSWKPLVWVEGSGCRVASNAFPEQCVWTSLPLLSFHCNTIAQQRETKTNLHKS